MLKIVLNANSVTGTPCRVQWLRFHTSAGGDTGSIPNQGSKIQHAAQCSQKMKYNIKIFFKKTVIGLFLIHLNSNILMPYSKKTNITWDISPCAIQYGSD